MYMALYVEFRDWRKITKIKVEVGLEVGLLKIAALVMAFEGW